MKRLAAILCGLLAVAAFFNDKAYADKRVALVVGNGAYQNAPALATPANDANAVADLLRQNGFDVVEARTDLGNTDFKRLIREFASTARDADVAVMYFAGHGMNIGGANYLLPVDVKLASDLDAEDEAVSLDRVMRMLQSAKGLRVVLLDAARDNPFANSMQRTKGAAGTGLARFEPDTDDTFVVYAARPGTVADDIPGDRSAFAGALLKNLAVPGRDLRTAIGFARDDVVKATGGKQEVLVLGAFGGRALALVPEQKVTRQIAVLPNADPEQQQHFDAADRLNSRAGWDAFLAKYPSSPLADQARAKLARIAAVDSPAGPKRIAVLPAPGSEKPQAPVQNAVSTAPAASAPDPATVARELQTELRRVGCDPGAINGVWSANSRQALEQFNRRAETKFDTKVASVDALDAVKGQRGRICPLVCGSGQRSDGERCVAIPAQPKQQPKKAAAREREESVPRRRVRQKVEREAPPPRRQPVVREEAPVRAAPPVGLGIGGIGLGIGGIGVRF